MKSLANRIISIAAIETMKKICLPLQKMGIHHFAHDMTFGKNNISILTNNKKLFLDYYQRGLPIMCTNDDGRILAPGIYLSKYLMKKHRDCSQMIPVLGEKFNLTNTIHFVERENDCQHLFTLGANLDESDFLHLVTNHLDKFSHFINDYKQTASDIILAAKKPQNQISLPYFDDSSNQILESYHLNFNNKQPRLLHKETKKLIILSLQQKKCFELLLQGHSAKEIGSTMALSHRTIEHYIERIRVLLGCRNTKELIVSYSNHST